MKLIKITSIALLFIILPEVIAHKRAHASAMQERAIVTTSDQNRYRFKINGLEQQARIVIKSMQTQGVFTEIELTLPPGAKGPGLHMNRNYQTFHVLQGTLDIITGRNGKKIQAHAGTAVVIAPGMLHSYQNKGHEITRILTTVIKSVPDAPQVNLDNMYIEFSGVHRLGLPDHENDAALQAIQEKYLYGYQMLQHTDTSTADKKMSPSSS